MISNAAGIIIFLSVCGIVTSNPDRAVDCRKFVFAPLCRGVAAKRNLPALGNYGVPIFNNESTEQFLRSLDAAIASLGVENKEDNQSGMFTNKQNVIENIKKMYQKDKVDRFLNFLIDNKKSSSERDNVSAQEFENL